MADKKEPTPEKKPTPFAHPGKRVYLLVPSDNKEADIVLKHLEQEIFPQLETLPRVTTQLEVNKFRGGEIVYLAHPVEARLKQPDGTFREGLTVHVGGPADTASAVGEDAEGFPMVNTDEIVKLITPLTKGNPKGRMYQLRLHPEHVKLVNY